MLNLSLKKIIITLIEILVIFSSIYLMHMFFMDLEHIYKVPNNLIILFCTECAFIIFIIHLMVFFKRIPLLKQLQSTINSNKCNKKNIFTNTLELIYINSRASNELKKEIEALHEVKNRLHRKEQELSEQSQILFKKENLLISQKNGLKEKEEEIAKYINKVFEQQEQEKIIKFIVGIIRESLELDKVLEKTVEEIGRLINADRCLIGIFEESEQKFELLNEYKSEPNLVSILDYQNEARLNKENLYQLVNRKKPIIINDSQKGQVSSNLNPFIELYEIKSYAIIPLIHKKEVLGIIIVCQTKTQREWKENHIELLSDIGSQIGIAIKQAYLHKQLQEATNLKSQFLANMSHEFRTPLNAIIGFSEMLLTGNYGDLTSKQLEYLKNISISGKHLLRLVGDILDLSKVESGKMQLNNERFDAKHIINETIALLSNQASPKDIEIITTIEQVYLYTDIRIFRQIIFNLLSNAIKFTENGGAITINSKLINNKLITEIIDTGIGIPDKDKDKIFKQFTQLDSSYSRKQEGTGLGLALTKKLVELQNGEINFESEEGTGSRFWFELSCIDTPVKEYTNI